MKKYLSLLLACVLALALLCACGGKDAAEQTPAPETPPTQTAAAGWPRRRIWPLGCPAHASAAPPYRTPIGRTCLLYTSDAADEL